MQNRRLEILLVHPQNYLQRYSTGIYRRNLRYAPLTMPTLKALVPEELNASVEVVDEMVREVDFDKKPDLVGITAITGTAPRAYEIADRFRANGTPVVLGGVHPTLLPEEAARHADSVVIGYAERTWPKLLKDFLKNSLAPVYQDEAMPGTELVVSPDRSSILKRDYIGWCTAETSRGCPNICDFCISHVFCKQYQCRPVGRVIDEIRQLKGKVIFFLDPNLTGDHDFAKELFTEFAKLKKWWVGCASLDIVDDPELLEIMAGSGCKGLLMGFESTDNKALIEANKIRNQGRDYADVVRILHGEGILIQACFVFGFDSDEPSVFDRTSEYIIKTGFDLPQISIFTPFPGTPVFARMTREGRILTRDWSRYNGQCVVFRPENMTVEELESGVDGVRRECYSMRALARRMVTPPLLIKPLVALAYFNFRRYQRAIDRVTRELS